MVFFGEYQQTFSSPGRLLLPKKIRELLKGNMFILTKGFNDCLAGFDKDDWESRAGSLMQVSLLEQENLEKRRFVFSSVTYPEIDDQGRFVIPKGLLQYAGLNEEVVIIGVGDHFEIWNARKWKKYASSSTFTSSS